MTTVAVTGVSGFIGDAVARRYADAGATVRGLDRRRPDPADPLTPDADPRSSRCEEIHSSSLRPDLM